MAQTAFDIAGETIAPGERRTLAIPVSQQLTGVSASLALQVLHGARPGPCIFVSAAIHGDEVNGIAIVQRLAKLLDPADLAGTVMLAPAVNVFGVLNHSRYLPDRRDLNRSFPGSTSGSLASQLARCFFDHVIARCELGIDLHTAAVHRYNLPQIRIAAGDADLLTTAMAFGAPLVIQSALRDGSMRELAHRSATPMLLFEAGEALRFDKLSISIGTEGVLRVMELKGMIAADPDRSSLTIPARADRTSWLRAPRGGIAHLRRESGDTVREGEVLASVAGLFGEDPLQIVSPFDAIVIGHGTLPIVNQGDAVFHLATDFAMADPGARTARITQSIMDGEREGGTAPMLDEDEVD